MELLLISNVMSPSSYEKMYNERSVKRIEPSQKFFNLIVDGISENKEINITCLTVKLLAHDTYKKIRINREVETAKDNLEYHYVGFINYTLLKQLSLMYTVKKEVKRWINKNKDKEKVIVIDPMLIESTHVALKLAKKYNIKTFSFITDIPCLTFSTTGKLAALKKKFINMSTNDLSKFDNHILLTDQMNDLFNKERKPNLIIESVVYKDIETTKKGVKDNKFTIMYAGKLHEQFGIKKLVQAVKEINNKNLELIIYGDGDSIKYIKDAAEEDSRIKYLGILPFEEIEREETRVSLLINPRPTNEEFTKYSFPSKTVEYMLSGTPFLTTKLEGIPKEYFKYLNVIEEDSVEGIKNAIIKVLETSYDDLLEKAKKAQDFVKCNKNYIIQGQKIIKFIMENK